jgi:hypothetical protein
MVQVLDYHSSIFFLSQITFIKLQQYRQCLVSPLEHFPPVRPGSSLRWRLSKGRPRDFRSKSLTYVHNVVILLCPTFVKRRTRMFIFSKVGYQIPFFAHRIVMNICKLLKDEFFAMALFPRPPGVFTVLAS